MYLFMCKSYAHTLLSITYQPGTRYGVRHWKNMGQKPFDKADLSPRFDGLTPGHISQSRTTCDSTLVSLPVRSIRSLKKRLWPLVSHECTSVELRPHAEQVLHLQVHFVLAYMYTALALKEDRSWEALASVLELADIHFRVPHGASTCTTKWSMRGGENGRLWLFIFND